jgi:hypothetical protein
MFAAFSPRAARRSSRCLVAMALVCAGFLAAPVVADATGVTWSAPVGVAAPQARPVEGISCPTASQCTSVAPSLTAGTDVATFDPQSPASATHKTFSVSPAYIFGTVVCPSATQCSAVEGVSNGSDLRVATFNPQSPGSTTDVTVSGSAHNPSNALVCPSVTRCVTVDNRGGVASFNPQAAGTTAPSLQLTPHNSALNDVSCPSLTVCIAVDPGGDAYRFHADLSPVPRNHDPASTDAYRTLTINPGSNLWAVACPSETRCTAVDYNGGVVTFDPTFDPTYTPPPPTNPAPLVIASALYADHAMRSVACPSPTQCTALDSSGAEMTFNPTSLPSSVTATPVDSGTSASVVCAAVTQCIVGTSDGQVATFNPESPGPPSSTLLIIGTRLALTNAACSSPTLCTMTDQFGRLVTFDPRTPTSVYRSPNLTPSASALACPSSTQCTVIGGPGDAATFNPKSPPPIANTTTIAHAAGSNPVALACPSVTLCVMIDDKGSEATFNPRDMASAPGPVAIDAGRILSSVACPTTSECVAVDYDGNRITFDPNAPLQAQTVSTGKIFGAVACPTATQCIAGDLDFGGLTSFDPHSAFDTPPVAAGRGVLRMACASVTLCVTTSIGGSTIDAPGFIADGDPLDAASWTTRQTTRLGYAAACASADLCVVGNADGTVTVGSVPVPVPVPPAAVPPAPPVTAPAPPPTVVSPVPLSTIVKAALAKVLVPSGKGAAIGKIVKSGYAFTFTAPVKGTLTITWSTKVKRKGVVIAKASAVVTAGKKTTVKVKLTKAGKKMLKKAKTLKVTSKVSFAVKGMKAITATRTFNLNKSTSAHGRSV